MSRIIFAGTPEFAAIHLRALLASGITPIAVYTQPDRPAGRGQQLQKSPVKLLAEAHQIPVYQPSTLRDESAQQTLRELHADLMIVVAYGLILPASVLAMPRCGCVNVHASLLPRWRGAAPIQRAIAAGDHETGTALMQMETGLDTGAILAEIKTDILPNDTAASLHDRLAQLGAQLLSQNVPALLAQTLTPRVQASEGVTYAHKIEKAEALIDWRHAAQAIDRQVRAFNPFPIACSHLQHDMIKIHAGFVSPPSHTAMAGTIVAVDDHAVHVACGDGVYAITEMQWPGGKKLPVKELLNSKRDRLRVGVRFEEKL